MMLESASRPCFGHHNKGLPQSIRFIRSTKIIPRGRGESGHGPVGSGIVGVLTSIGRGGRALPSVPRRRVSSTVT